MPRQRLLFSSIFLSGFAALLYQNFWVRKLQFAFGSTTPATAAVLAVFMLGLGLGAWAYQRLKPGRALRAYALIEISLGVLAWSTGQALDWLPRLYDGAQASPEILPGFGALILLPACTLAGASLPAATAALGEADGEALRFSRAYFANLLGAALGSLAAAFWLLPALGLPASLSLAALCNTLPGLLLLKGSLPSPRQGGGGPTGGSLPVGEGAQSPARTIGASMHADGAAQSPALLIAAAVSGLSFLILELTWMRSFTLLLGASSWALGLMLAAVLLSLALGSLCFAALAHRERPWQRWAAQCSLLAAALLPLQAMLIGQAPKWIFWLQQSLAPAQAAAAALSLCFALTLLVSLPLGLCFPCLVAAAPKGSTGRLLAVNSLGAALGAPAAATWLAAGLGLQPLYALGAGLGAWNALLLWGRPLDARLRLCVLFTAALGSVALAPRFHPWDKKLVSAGLYRYGAVSEFPRGHSLGEYLANYNLLSYTEGAESIVTVRERAGERALAVNGRQESATRADLATQKLLVHLPLGLHPAPRTALVIGWGSGSTTGSASLHALAKLRCVEIQPEVAAAAPFFSEVQLAVKEDPAFSLVLDDARHQLLSDPERYDVIISEPSHPWIRGVASLFSDEFYRLARRRLNSGAVFAQWFQLYDVDAETLRLQLRTFAAAFEDVSLWVAPLPFTQGAPSDLVLIGRERADLDALPRLDRLFHKPAVAGDLLKVGLGQGAEIRALNLFDDKALRAFAGEGPTESDLRPRLEFSALRDLFQGGGEERRKALLAQLDRAASEPVEPSLVGRLLGAESARKARLEERCEGLLKMALTQSPQNAEALMTLGRLRAVQQRVDEARKLLGQSLRLKPSLGQAWVSLGQLEMSEQHFEVAAAHFARMARQFPKLPDPLYGQALALWQFRDVKGAKGVLKKLKEKFPKFRPAQELDARMLAGQP